MFLGMCSSCFCLRRGFSCLILIGYVFFPMGYPERACFAFESGAGPAASLCPREPVLCSWGTQLARAAPTRPPSCVPPACRSVGFPHSSGSRAHLASLQTASRTPAAARGARHVTAQRWTHGFISPLRRRLHCVPGLPAVAYQRRFQGGFHVLRGAAASPMPLGASHHDTCTDFGTDGSSGLIGLALQTFRRIPCAAASTLDAAEHATF